MKKQILFILLLALFAGTIAYGQAVPGSGPRPVSCIDDALHPIAGKPYEYTVGVDPTGGNFKWVATKNSTFISAAGILPDSLPINATNLLAASLNYGDVATSDKVTITWSDAILANTTYNTNPTFVAVHYSGTACADNMKAYQIDPIQAFVVDIKNIEDGAKTILGYDIAESQCIANIASATFDGTGMLYDYGIDTLYYEVVAANFTGSWDPTFAVTGLNAAQTSTLEWTYAQPSTWDGSTVWNAENTNVSTDETNTSNGVSIYVRLIVANNKYEGISASVITLAVDGVNSLGHLDVVNADCSTPTVADFADFAEQTINPRPKITAGTSSAIGPNTTLIPAN
jgi:hypothetical protein